VSLPAPILVVLPDETPSKNAQISRFSLFFLFFQVSRYEREERRNFDDIMGGGS